jgi:hypothetical protein
MDDFIFSSDRTGMVRYFGPSPEVALPPDIRIVGPGCFSNCENLTAVPFPPGLARIEGLFAIKDVWLTYSRQ